MNVSASQFTRHATGMPRPLGTHTIRLLGWLAFAAFACLSKLHAQYATLTTLYNFPTASPTAGLTQGADGNFYGAGYDSGDNVLYQLTPAGQFTVVHRFSTPGSDGTNTDGTEANALIVGSDGNFYGTTYGGGPNGTGTIFKLTPGGDFTTIYSFSAANDSNTDGEGPGVLVQGSDGNFYGTTTYGGGGNGGCGTVFKVTPAGVCTGLYSFGFYSTPAYPNSPLVQGDDGNFYGTTISDLQDVYELESGTVFKITPRGDFSIIDQLADDDALGIEPSALVRGSDGSLYGTTAYDYIYGYYDAGGNEYEDYEGDGSAFRITTGGSEAKLYSFDKVNENGGTPLYQAKGGNFYGEYLFGIYQLTPGGTCTPVYSFTDTKSYGSYPQGDLIQGSDGHFYGTTRGGGAYGYGTVFKMAFPPIITSATTATVTIGNALSYQIKATPAATSFAVQGLPAGLTVDASTGLISGTPQAVGTYTLTLQGFNNDGEGSTPLKLMVVPPTPVITSATTATATEGQSFSYQITATNSPTSFGVQGLGDGLTADAKTGLITGTPTSAGKLPLTLNAYNGVSKGSATLTVTIAAVPPVITSASTATATEGTAFSYQITASNHPTSYGVQGLPAGLTASASTGLISGTPTSAGKVSLTLNAYNSTGKGSATLTVTIAAVPPGITSATTATGTIGKAFSYQIAASNHPTSFGVQGLPAGLTVDSSTGLISGTLKGAGTVKLTLNAYNAAGKGSATLTLTVKSS